MRGGYVRQVSAEALGLYLFLVTVGDCRGLSYFSDRSITEYLSHDVRPLRAELVHADLIAYRAPLYQVLSLLEPLSSRPNRTSASPLTSLAEVLRTLSERT